MKQVRTGLRRLTVEAVLLAAVGWLGAQSDSFFCIGMNASATYWGEHDYLADADSVGANWVMVDVAMAGGRISQVLADANERGMKVLLNSVSLDTLGGLTIGGASSGRWCRHEAEDICGPGDAGENVFDSRAGNQHARLVYGDSGWIQSDTVGFWSDVSGFPYTAVFRLRADTSGAGSPEAPVCSLVVVDYYFNDHAPPALVESVVGVRVLQCSDFPQRDTYDDFAVKFVRVQDRSAARCQFRVYCYGNVDSLWSDNVEVFDAFADGLLRYTPGVPYPPLMAKVTAKAAYWNRYAAVYRYMLIDEPGPDVYRSCRAVREAVELAYPYDRTAATWVNSRFSDCIDAVALKEEWVDCYPTMGATWPHQDSTRPPPDSWGRTPVDSGARFQGRLDTMCMALGLAREAARRRTPETPMMFDVQAFGEYLTDADYTFDTTLNHVSSPGDTPRADESIWREPTSRELNCMVWLSLAYGVKGITYWLFPALYGQWPYTGPAWKYYYLMGLLGWDPAGNCPGGHRPMFNYVKRVNDDLRKIGPTLTALTSTAVGKWNGAPIKFIQSSTDSLVHFGTFEGLAAQYFIIVNRDCRKDSFRLDTVGLGLSSTAPSYFLHDEVTGEAIAPLPREGQDPYRFALRLGPGQGRLFRVVPLAGWIKRNQGYAYSNLRPAALAPGYWDGTDVPVDSMRIFCRYFPDMNPDDTSATDWDLTDSTAWLAYRSELVGWAKGEGWNRFGVRYRLQDGAVTPCYWGEAITVDMTAPVDSMTINHDALRTNSVLCTLCSYSRDNSGILKMQFTNNCAVNPELILRSGMSDQPYWWTRNCVLVESLGLARMELVPAESSYVFHRIQAESLAAYDNWRMTIAADVVSDSLVGSASLMLRYRYALPCTSDAQETTVVLAAGVPIAQGTAARVAGYNYEGEFVFHPSPPPGYAFVGADAGIFALPAADSGGRLYIDNVRLDAAAPDSGNETGWQGYATEFYPWRLPGERVNRVKARYQDQAGNEGAWVGDSIVYSEEWQRAEMDINPGSHSGPMALTGSVQGCAQRLGA
jgi:hypothetical protein